jgi:HD-GYP domain-containing protein (c-di-GMP phosphodiesterase class II)
VHSDSAVYLQSFIRQVTTALSTSLLYSLEHQQVTRLCAAALESLRSALGDDAELSILVIDDELVAGNRPIPNSMYINRFVQTLKGRGIGNIRFLRGISTQELKTLLAGLTRHSASADELRPTDNIRFGRVEIRQALDESSDELLAARAVHIRTLADVPVEELATFMEIYEEARRNKKLNVVGISEIVSCFIDSFRQVSDPLLALAPLRAMDEYTFTHSTNVCILNLAQAMSLGIEGPLLHDIGFAAMLHDIGKLYVPEEVLTKPGKLDDAEWELIRQHPLKGAQRLLETPGVPRLAVVTAYEHHLKYNQTGYPQVSPGWQQNLCSHMTTISDFFDALRTKRSYRQSMEFSTIAAIMTEMAGTDLHPLLTRNFLRVISRLSEQPEEMPQETSPAQEETAASQGPAP